MSFFGNNQVLERKIVELTKENSNLKEELDY
jgi:hypothetical protein